MIPKVTTGATLFRKSREGFVLPHGCLRNEVIGVWDAVALPPRAAI